jgi:hypothetical protein
MAAAAPEAAADVAPSATLSVYQAARRIKRRASTLYNALRSVAEDAAFVAEVAALWPSLPLVANLRCGLWYAPPRAFASTCYFKSTDGHAGNWSFSTARLNLHLALLAGACCFSLIILGVPHLLYYVHLLVSLVALATPYTGKNYWCGYSKRETAESNSSCSPETAPLHFIWVLPYFWAFVF